MKPLTEKEIQRMIANRFGITITEAKQITKFFKDTIAQGIKNNGKVVLLHFGTFRKKIRKGREIKNPFTGKTIKVGDALVAKFKPSETLKQYIK